MNVQCILAVEDPYKYYVCSVCMCVCVFVCSCVQCVASASTFNISPVLIIFFVFIDFVECKLFDDSLSIALKTKKKPAVVRCAKGCVGRYCVVGLI